MSIAKQGSGSGASWVQAGPGLAGGTGETGTTALPVTGVGDPLIEVTGLCVDYGFGAGAVHAVLDADLTLRRGEVLGLAGESGSGKSTLAYAITRLLRAPGVITGGQVLFRPPDRPAVSLLAAGEQELRGLRWDQIAVVLQSAMNALNPVLRIGEQLTDVLLAHRPDMSKPARRARAAELLELVDIPADRLGSYPHELSGGMRQRVMIAVALALDPQVVIMDEPTTALDVVTQREILEELTRLRDRLGFAIMFITHDLSLLVEIADSIAVMYAGQLVEQARRKGDLPRAQAPVFTGPAQLVSRTARAAPVHGGHPRVSARPARSSCRVRVPSALRLRVRQMPHGQASAVEAGPAIGRLLAA